MKNLRFDYKNGDIAIANLARLIVLIATVASAYAVYHFNISEFQHEMAKRRVLMNSLFLLESIKDEKSMRMAGPRELVDHLLGDLALHGSFTDRQEMLEKFSSEVQKALGDNSAILTEFPLFYSVDSCPVALWPLPSDPMPPNNRGETIKFAVLPGAFCSILVHALLPAALEFSIDWKPLTLLITRPLYDLFPAFSIFRDCSVQGVCTDIPALLPTQSSLVRGYPFLRGLGDSRQAVAMPMELAGIYVASYWPPDKEFVPLLEAKRELERELRKQSPLGSQRFLGFDFKGSLAVPFVALGALSGLAILLIASIVNLRRGPVLSLSAPSLLVDPVGLFPKFVRVAIACGPFVAAMTIVLCVQDYLRRPFVIPLFGEGIYVNPLRWQYFRTGDPALHDTRLFEVSSGSAEASYIALLIIAIAAIGVCALASGFLLSLSASATPDGNKRLTFRARRMTLLKGRSRATLGFGVRKSR